MATVNETVLELLDAADIVPQTHGDIVTERLDCADLGASSQIEVVPAEELEVSDSVVDTPIEVILETLEVGDSASDVATLATTIVETLKVSDSLSDVQITHVTESLDVNDLVTDAAPVETITENLEVLDSAPDSITVSDLCLEVLEVADEIIQWNLDVVTESLDLVDVITSSATVAETVLELLDTSDSVIAAAVMFDTVTESLVVDSVGISGSSTINETIVESLEALDIVMSSNPLSLAWVLNTETGAPSYYTNFQFTGLAEFQGYLFATSSDGLYLLDGEDDSGTNIDATLSTGMEDFRLKEKKRISDIYFGYTGVGMEVEIETPETDTPYIYDLESRIADAPRNNRLQPGKGINSRYWKFTFNNIGGDNFQVHDITANAMVSRRRLS